MFAITASAVDCAVLTLSITSDALLVATEMLRERRKVDMD
jgi:hypothetical protein